jgi:riboflavin kinase / FMN adenylyltransferase
VRLQVQGLISGVESLKRSLGHTVVTIGNFDGVHLGHQTIIREACDQAKKRGGPSVAFTFRPHPHVALGSGDVQLLTTYDERAELLKKQGLDFVIEEPFTRDFSTITAERFFRDILIRKLNVEAIVVGYDFAFGKERKGHLESLQKLCTEASVQLTVVPAHRIQGEVVSSSRIRSHLVAGKIEEANRLLGHEFFYRGVVVKGEGRGRKIGFPTANLQLENKLVLPYGVYATRAVVMANSAGSAKALPSVTNLGVRPTFQSGQKTDGELPALVETYLLDQEIDLYGSTLEVRFLKRLREERKFSGVEELKAQIALDVQASRAHTS